VPPKQKKKKKRNGLKPPELFSSTAFLSLLAESMRLTRENVPRCTWETKNPGQIVCLFTQKPIRRG
jgi:hypothetical protein